MTRSNQNEVLTQYKHVRESWGIYWKSYGGYSALLRSPYFHFAILISSLCRPVWAIEHEGWAWYSICVDVIPNILGFTLGGYAMLLAFGNEKFQDLLAGDDGNGEPSAFMKVNGTFIHFIVLQIIALLAALISFGWDVKTGVFAFIGFTTFVYALFSAVAAALAILRLAGVFDYFLKTQKKTENQKNVSQTKCKIS